MKRWTIVAAALLLAACTPDPDLAGLWEFQLDPEGTVTALMPFDDTIALPGTTDLSGKGNEPERTDETMRLTRRHAYAGKAWYRKKVVAPAVWKDRDLVLFLERTKPSALYLDGEMVGSSNDVSTPQSYNLGKLRPGVHTLALCVDNGGGVPEGVIRSSHLYSDDTQTNWNGIIGRIELAPAETFGTAAPAAEMPRLEIVDGHFEAAGHPVFLRGTHDGCVFPHTGHTPMDKATWAAYFEKCREYGLNHMRFHSWCPPEAAFAAADEAGFYLQPELPFWGTVEGEELVGFLRKEGLNIVRTYGHHPSFALFSLGNELWGDPAVMRDIIDTLRAEAPQILYTGGTNAYLGYEVHPEGLDFFSTCRLGGEPYGAYDTHVRSSFSFADVADGGILNHFHPGTRLNFREALEASPIPVIGHETGQFQVYPDYAETDKYEGTPFVPYNQMEFRRRLEASGMGDQADAFHKASGKWVVELYKADIEMCLRTPGFGGFQLLDIKDYPGQGSAYVGILDAFMDSKGLVDPAAWRGWCSDLVPLAEFDKYCWSEDETFRARLLLAKFTEGKIAGIRWSLGEAGGELAVPEGEGLLELGDIETSLTGLTRTALKVSVRLSDGSVRENAWPVWVYPAGNRPDKTGVTVARKVDKSVLRALEAGEKVLLMPSDTAGTVGGLFMTDYWNYRMFRDISRNNGKPVSPGTLGILTDPSHPLFREFPTEGHTGWQWFPVLKASRPRILDSLEGYRPIVQVIDNVERNHRLGLVFEFAVGKGRLLVCCSDLESIGEYPEGRQFYKAVLNYMRSTDFHPQTALTGEQLKALF